MKAAPRTLLLCTALISSLAQAADLDLKLRDPLWADATLTAQPALESRIPFEVVLGLVGGLVVAVPTAFASYQIGSNMAPPYRSCDELGCDSFYGIGGVLWFYGGAFVGFAVGTGLGVASAGLLQGGAFHWGQAIGGAAIGGLLGFAGSLVLSGVIAMLPLPMGYVAVLAAPIGTIAGAVIGSAMWYHASLPFPEVKATPVVALVPGGGTLGLAGSF